MSDISGATALEMVSTERSVIVAQLNEAASTALIWPWGLVATVILMIISPWFLIAGIPLTIWLFWKDAIRRTAVAFYDVHGDDEARRFQQLVDSFARVQSSQAAWHIVAEGSVSNTYQHKVNAGASSLVNRVALARGVDGPKHLSSNVAIPTLAAGNRSIHFLPDRILVRDGRTYAEMTYATVRASATTHKFIESGAVPRDSSVVGQTWQYVNVRGGPDRRFKNNRQLPIVQYGQLTVVGESGYRGTFDISDASAGALLADALGHMAAASRRPISASRGVQIRPQQTARPGRPAVANQHVSPRQGPPVTPRRHAVAPAAKPAIKPNTPHLRAPHVTPSANPASVNSPKKASALVDVNSAGRDQICELPGFASEQVTVVVEIREALDGFVSFDEFAVAAGLVAAERGRLRDSVRVVPRAGVRTVEAQACYELAQRFAKRRDWARARMLFERASEGQSAWSSAAAFALATMLDKQDDNLGAEAVYRSIINSPNYDTDHHAQATYYLAEQLRKKNDWDQARTLYQQAIQLNHHAWSPAAAFALATMLDKQDNNLGAEAVYRSIINSPNYDPDHHAQATYYLAEQLRKKNDWDQARTLYQQAIQLNHHAWSPIAERGLGELDEKRSHLTEAAQPPPSPTAGSVVQQDLDAVDLDEILLETPQPARRSSRSRSTASARWHPPGQAVSLSGYDIGGGMLYVGGAGTEHFGSSPDPSWIDPSLAVDVQRPDWAGEDLGYWPSYSEISPQGRAAYLGWLADDRCRPDINIGYVFLYFYGLERRVLVDFLQRDQPNVELESIADEVRRLRTLYADNGSFDQYSSQFLQLLAGFESALAEPPPYGCEDRWPLPLALQRGLSKFAVEQQPVPDSWALSWAWYHPNIYPRTPQLRCPHEYRELFSLKYRERHGDGLVITPGTQPIGLSYYPASAACRGVTFDLPDTIDVSEDQASARALRALTDEVTQALDAYSRFVGRHPDARDTVAAEALLPADLALPADGPSSRLLAWAGRQLGSQDSVVIDGRELIKLWSSSTAESLTKPEAISCAQLLERERIGIEPDVRLGGPKPANGPVVLFTASPATPRTAGPAYSAATTVLELGVAVGVADGSIDSTEQAVLLAHIASALDLTDAERERLTAHLRWLCAKSTPGEALTRMKGRLADLTKTQRSAVAELLVLVAAADRVISAGEVTALQKTYKLLGFNPNDVYSALHGHTAPTPTPGPASAASPAPITSAPRGRLAVKPDPRLSANGPSRVDLDDRRLAATAASTAQVAKLLADVFADDEFTDPHSEPSLPKLAGPHLDGLDSAHTAIVAELVQRDQWERNEFEALAAGLGLMPAAALDTINDFAFQRCGEPLLDVDDQLVLNDFAVQELAR